MGIAAQSTGYDQITCQSFIQNIFKRIFDKKHQTSQN